MSTATTLPENGPSVSLDTAYIVIQVDSEGKQFKLFGILNRASCVVLESGDTLEDAILRLKNTTAETQQNQIDMLNRFTALETWASANGYTPPATTV